jgi:hypothetical protein
VAVLLATGLAAAYLGLLLCRLPAFVADLSWNSDAVSPAVLVDDLRSGTSPTVLGDITSATTLALYWVLQALPGHRVLWSVAPLAISLLGAASLAWSVARVGGRAAGLLAGAVVVATAPAVLMTQIAPAFHGTTWAVTSLIGAALVTISQRPGAGWPARLALALALGGLGGVSLVADPLLGPAGIAPLALAPLAAAGTPRWRALVATCWACALMAVLSAAAVVAWMGQAGLASRRSHSGAGTLVVTSPEDVVRRIAGVPATALPLAGPGPAAASAVLVVAAAALVLGATRFRPPRRPNGSAAARRCLTAFWTLSMALVLGAYCLSGAVSDEGTYDQRARYLVPLLYGAAALGGLWAGSSRRRALLWGMVVSLYVSLNLAALPGGRLAAIAQQGQLRSVGADVEAWLDARGVRRGYAGYWDANVLRYRGRLRVAAVAQCDVAGRRSLCPDLLNSRRAWYSPSRTRSFLLVNQTPGGAHVVSTLPSRRRFGVPTVGRRFGALSVWVYPYDLAARFHGRWSRSEGREHLLADQPGQGVRPRGVQVKAVGAEPALAGAHGVPVGDGEPLPPPRGLADPAVDGGVEAAALAQRHPDDVVHPGPSQRAHHGVGVVGARALVVADVHHDDRAEGPTLAPDQLERGLGRDAVVRAAGRDEAAADDGVDLQVEAHAEPPDRLRHEAEGRLHGIADDRDPLRLGRGGRAHGE